MTQAKCFECGKPLGISTPMESLIEEQLPTFCSIPCSMAFPDKYTKEFDRRLKQLKEGDSNRE